MKCASRTRVWNFDLPPYPREGLFHLDMSAHCQVNRELKFQAGQLARINQLDVFADPAQLKRFQTGLRRRLWRRMGVEYPSELPLEVKELGRIREEGFTIVKLVYQGRKDVFVTGLLHVPAGEGPFPAVLQMHGHDPLGKFGINSQSMALSLVKNGYVCLTVDTFGTYERADEVHTLERHGGYLGASLLNLGETLLGAQVVDNMRGVDVLRSLPCVLNGRIGAVGASGGGNQVMWLSAMDTRIAAAMPVVSVGSFESYVSGMNCMCELLPDGLTLTEESGVLALIAPRPLRIGNALYDCNHDFSVNEMLKTYHPVERIYWNLGKAENISFHVADRVHGLTDRQRESALGFFAWALKGQGNGNALPEPENDPYEEKDLYLFQDSEARRSNRVCSIPEYCRLRGGELRQAYLSRGSFSAARCRAGLRRMLRLAFPSRGRVHRYQAVDGVGRAALEADSHLIPFLIIPGDAAGKFRILAHPEGKAALTADELQLAAADGSTLILPDLYGTGETAQPNHTIALHHQFFRQLLWLGRSLMGEWTRDLLALAPMLYREFDAAWVEVTGIREMGFAALCAKAFSDRIRKVTADHTPGSLCFDYEKVVGLIPDSPFEKFLPGLIYSPAMSIPGFLQWGDVSLLAALGGEEIEFSSPCTYEGRVYAREEEEHLQKEIQAVERKLTGRRRNQEQRRTS